jgi:hypothetical protein
MKSKATLTAAHEAVLYHSSDIMTVAEIGRAIYQMGFATSDAQAAASALCRKGKLVRRGNGYSLPQ